MQMEQIAKQPNIQLDNLTDQQLDELWEEAKNPPNKNNLVTKSQKNGLNTNLGIDERTFFPSSIYNKYL